VLLAQLSDFHIGADETALRDAAAAIAAVAALRPAPDAVLVTGDLVEHALPEEYGVVRELLAALPMPVHVLPGNHDERGALRTAFPLPGAGPYRWAAGCGSLRLIGCDSTVPGELYGSLAGELGWLEERLVEERGRPTIVAMHHPPLPTGMPALDRIGLPDADQRALGELLARFPEVLRVVTGHVHLSSSGTVGPCPVATSLSTWRLRSKLLLGAEEFVASDEPAGFSLHVLVDGRLVSHAQPL
jgi:3',5'-cyclic AMP phosphodiesterase CpdA